MKLQAAGAANQRGGFVNQHGGFVNQHGGFAMGLIVGLLVGLALALGVALYIAKVPSPFHDKVPHRSPEQDAAEAEKLKNWDPNAGLGGKPASHPAGPLQPFQPASAASPGKPAVTGPPPAAPKPARDAAAILAGEPVPGAAPRASAPLRPGVDPFVYFVQAGAFSSPDDAEQQRAKLALQGFAAKISEREQSGRAVHRVRLGPFDSLAEAESQQERVKAAGVDAALVRQERPRN
jgi:cell division protein FtsN